MIDEYGDLYTTNRPLNVKEKAGFIRSAGFRTFILWAISLLSGEALYRNPKSLRNRQNFPQPVDKEILATYGFQDGCIRIP